MMLDGVGRCWIDRIMLEGVGQCCKTLDGVRWIMLSDVGRYSIVLDGVG